jgi:putative lipoprotein
LQIVSYAGLSVYFFQVGSSVCLEEKRMSAVRAPLALMLAVLLLALPGAAQAQGSATVSGTITYRERIILPSNAVVTVQIADISVAGRPAQVIAEQKFTTNGAQVPFRFTLTYDALRVNASGSYIVQGNISVNGQLRFTTAAPYRVISQGNPTTNVNIIMVSSGGGNLPNTSGGTGLLAIAGLLAAAVVGVRLVRMRSAAR